MLVKGTQNIHIEQTNHCLAQKKKMCTKKLYTKIL